MERHKAKAKPLRKRQPRRLQLTVRWKLWMLLINLRLALVEEQFAVLPSSSFYLLL
ncbi:hypothetical protein M378DRAFT_168916 [Amanita muscaria Koide BX008]|uniref:Uncharacterized protein n=1 Tax=Amanita muscaria (strain Koide BX008) TaxID=946122 RepID=A0A0C2WSP8_AMAMK|nr:hypothetical protein M378DRAFT_168916 [Amanita muscaria Koide BX008]